MFDLKVVGELQAPEHSLLASVEKTNPGDDKWLNGVTFTQRGCYEVQGSCLVCEDTPANTFDEQDCTPPAEFLPYELDLGSVWAPQDNFDIKAAVIDDLKVGSSSRLEALAWAGCVGGTNPTLGGGTSLGAALAPKGALGNVMAALIDADDHIGARGTIYMSPRIVTEFADLIRDDDGVLYTVYGGHKVILGNFPITHIAAHIGEPMVVVEDEVRFLEAADEIRRANLRTFRAQRSALVAWNTCAAFTQQVTLP